MIEDMCRSTRASAVPVVPDSEGTDSNPFSLDALAVFMFRVLQRVNHPGNLDKASPNAGYVLLMFYHLYEARHDIYVASRKEFESELIERFGSLVKMPLLKSDRSTMPDSVKNCLEEGINLYRLHTNRHGSGKVRCGAKTMHVRWKHQNQQHSS
ncbi:tRNA ligase 1 [Vitis vinifera]|uniref:tRNA ligase 1 n=1 Tax=Vitis vinifera TaxID=29760 RepID=A0A438KNR4_VITVI|nr:tRNA ligase 1 [Vitis vinifera]